MDSSTLRIPAFKRKKSLKQKAKKMSAAAARKAKRPARPALPASSPKKTLPKLRPVGMITHFYDKIKVAVLKLSSPLKVGDSLRLKGKKGEFDQVVKSMQIDHKPVAGAARGADLGLKVKKEVRVDEIAYKIIR